MQDALLHGEKNFFCFVMWVHNDKSCRWRAEMRIVGRVDIIEFQHRDIAGRIYFCKRGTCAMG